MITDEKDIESAWYAEADAIEFCESDFDAAFCSMLPDELDTFAEEAIDDDDFDELHTEWLTFLECECKTAVLLGIEQSCHEGILLPWDMRGVRLKGIPDEVLSTLHFFWRECPEHVAAYLMLRIYWLVRIERARRKGKPDWSCREPAPPRKEKSAFFRPSKLVFRRQI